MMPIMARKRPKPQKPKYYPQNCSFRFYFNLQLRVIPAGADIEPGHLIARFQAGQEAAEGDLSFQWSHILICKDKDGIITSDYPLAPTPTSPGVVIGTPKQQIVATDGITYPEYLVVFQHRVRKGRPDAHRRVYLQRQTPET